MSKLNRTSILPPIPTTADKAVQDWMRGVQIKLKELFNDAKDDVDDNAANLSTLDSTVTTLSGDLDTAESAITTLQNGKQATLQIAIFREEQSAGTNGGNFASGDWRTRVLNTTVVNTITSASLSSNQVTLPSGTYQVSASAPASQCGLHKTLLYNVTDGADIEPGTSEQASGAHVIQSRSHVNTVFTLAAQKVIALKHRCETTRNTDGLGLACNLDSKVEVYAEIVIIKLS